MPQLCCRTNQEGLDSAENWTNKEQETLKNSSLFFFFLPLNRFTVSPRPQSMLAVVLRFGNYVSMSADAGSCLVDLLRGRREDRGAETLRSDEVKELHHLSPKVRTSKNVHVLPPWRNIFENMLMGK